MENVVDTRIPCYRCTERSQICHAQCERYHAWVAERKRINAAARKGDVARNYKIENYGKRKR